MRVDKIQITIRELTQGYEEKGLDGIEGIVAYGCKLDVRPPYQREYVYAPKERDEVIRTVKKEFPLNIMYWAKSADGHFELMDGQQRTISICRYAAESERTFTVDENGDLTCDVCEGTLAAKTGLVFDADGNVRYYKNGVAVQSYGLAKDSEGNYYYINRKNEAT